ncbi:hypothetical protein QBC42DRAFT_10667 [Cladorrhinum samala]|uniref:Uncharacterized protein n=1 Tax=Cladorrhinum samala TaxID=585594 RepID=A0AAV9HFK7_9PEZI|nr:hypothetical protein QBC42DRAFT_10667 [Cladorrhinum samala]
METEGREAGGEETMPGRQGRFCQLKLKVPSHSQVSSARDDSTYTTAVVVGPCGPRYLVATADGEPHWFSSWARSLSALRGRDSLARICNLLQNNCLHVHVINPKAENSSSQLAFATLLVGWQRRCQMQTQTSGQETGAIGSGPVETDLSDIFFFFFFFFFFASINGGAGSAARRKHLNRGQPRSLETQSLVTDRDLVVSYRGQVGLHAATQREVPLDISAVISN